MKYADDTTIVMRSEVEGGPAFGGIFFGTDGQQRHGYEVVGYMPADEFTAHLRQALN
jgi:thiol:disulfide interchange protein